MGGGGEISFLCNYYIRTERSDWDRRFSIVPRFAEYTFRYVIYNPGSHVAGIQKISGQNTLRYEEMHLKRIDIPRLSMLADLMSTI